MVSGYLKDNPVKNGTDVNALMREMMSVILEGSLDGEMDEELGCFKNSRNGYKSKTLHISYETWILMFSMTEMGSLNLKWLRNIRTL